MTSVISAWPHPRAETLWAEICNVQPLSRALVAEIFEAIDVLCAPNGLSQFQADEPWYRTWNYVCRHLLPVAELSGWPASERRALPRNLACHLLWCHAWRRLDDVLDVQERSVDAISRAWLFLSMALAATLQSVETDRKDVAALAFEYVAITCDTAAVERTLGIAYSDIWKRAAPLLFVPERMIELPERSIIIYKDYINLAGLLHDSQDVLDDVARGIRSIPSDWLRTVREESALDLCAMNGFFATAESMLSGALETIRASLGDMQAPIMRLLLGKVELELGSFRSGARHE